MKRSSFATLAIVLSLIALPLGLRLFHLGPFGIRPGDDILLSRMTLANGAQLFVVGHRTAHFIDAYEVTLYRVEANGDAFRYYLGHEESYWWACSIRPATSSGAIEIRADGQVVARYRPHEDVVLITDGHHPPQQATSIKGDSVRRLLSRAKS
jgi:hypothetical protein